MLESENKIKLFFSSRCLLPWTSLPSARLFKVILSVIFNQCQIGVSIVNDLALSDVTLTSALIISII